MATKLGEMVPAPCGTSILGTLLDPLARGDLAVVRVLCIGDGVMGYRKDELLMVYRVQLRYLHPVNADSPDSPVPVMFRPDEVFGRMIRKVC